MNKHSVKLIIAIAVGMLSYDSVSAQHESEPTITISDNYDAFVLRPLCGRVQRALKLGTRYKGEIVIPGKYYSTMFNSYTMVNWITNTAFKGNALYMTSVYVPASATEYPTYLNLTETLAYKENYEDGSFSFPSNPNLKTTTYESPYPAFDTKQVWVSTNRQIADGVGWYCYEQEWEYIYSAFDNNPFKDCPALKSIVVLDPNTPLHSIKGVLFRDYEDVQELVAFPLGRTGTYSIPEPTNRIGPKAFPTGCKITSLTLPSTLSEVKYSDAFSQLTSLSTVIVNWTEPVSFRSTLFSDETYQAATLVVPDGTMPAYATTVPWSLFSNIKEQSANIETPVASSKELTCDVYNLSGIQCKSGVSPRDWMEGLSPGIYILRMSDGSTLKSIAK